MVAFRYRAVNPSGQIQKGHMLAANQNELSFFLSELNLELIEAKEQKSTPTFFLLPQKKSLKDLLFFCTQMHDLLSSGLPFTQALDLIIETLDPALLQSQLIAITKSIKSGTSIHASFAREATLFDAVSLALLEAGSAQGDLRLTFARIAEHVKWQTNMNRALSRALRYPIFLLCVAISVTSFMMGFVVPEIVSFLLNLGNELPFITRLLIGCADFVSKIWWSLPFLVFTCWITLFFGRRLSSAFTRRVDQLLLLLPGIGPIRQKCALARMASSFSTLMKTGLSMPHALQMAGRTLGNKDLEAKAEEAVIHLGTGHALSQATTALFPPMVLQIIKVAEKCGTLGPALENVAAYYERESHDSIERLLGTIEPTLTLFIGGLLAWIVLAVLGPVYGSLGTLSGSY